MVRGDGFGLPKVLKRLPAFAASAEQAGLLYLPEGPVSMSCWLAEGSRLGAPIPMSSQGSRQ